MFEIILALLYLFYQAAMDYVQVDHQEQSRLTALVRPVEGLVAEQYTDQFGNCFFQFDFGRTHATDAVLEKLSNILKDSKPALPVSINLIASHDVTSAGIRHLKLIPNLQGLYIETPKVNDEGLAALADLPHLRKLSICYLPMTDTGMKYLAGLKELQDLTIVGTDELTDSGLMHLKDLKKLRRLFIRGPKLTAASYAHFDALTEVEELDIGDEVPLVPVSRNRDRL